MKDIISTLKNLQGTHTGKEILFSLKELNKVLSWNQIDELLDKGASILGKPNYPILEELGLPERYYLAIPRKLFKEE